jgi:hypothetical protein
MPYVNYDENLVYVNEIEIYRPDTFNKKVELYQYWFVQNVEFSAVVFKQNLEISYLLYWILLIGNLYSLERH